MNNPLQQYTDTKLNIQKQLSSGIPDIQPRFSTQHGDFSLTWLRADPNMTTAGRTHNGGTGRTVTTIQSGRANLASNPIAVHSSSEIRLNISSTRSADNTIFFSCESSLMCFHSAVSSRPTRRILGWYRPHPP